jgi:hypothetical protein
MSRVVGGSARRAARARLRPRPSVALGRSSRAVARRRGATRLRRVAPPDDAMHGRPGRDHSAQARSATPIGIALPPPPARREIRSRVPRRMPARAHRARIRPPAPRFRSGTAQIGAAMQAALDLSLQYVRDHRSASRSEVPAIQHTSPSPPRRVAACGALRISRSYARAAAF